QSVFKPNLLTGDSYSDHSDAVRRRMGRIGLDHRFNATINGLHHTYSSALQEHCNVAFRFRGAVPLEIVTGEIYLATKESSICVPSRKDECRPIVLPEDTGISDSAFLDLHRHDRWVFRSAFTAAEYRH